MLQEPELNPSKENIYSLQETVPALETNNFAQQEATLAHNEIELIESLSISSLPETNKPKSTWQSINFQSRQITPENLMRTTMVEEENPKTKSEKEEEEKKEEEEFGEVMSSETTGELLLSIDTAYSKEEETSSLVLEEKVFKIETESEFPPVEPQFMVEDSICQQLTTVTEEVHTAKEMGFSFSDITDIGEEGEEGYSKATSSKTSISEEILLEEVSEQFAAENGLEILKIGITIPKHGERRPERLNVDTTVESVNKSIDVPADKNMADFVTPPTPGVPPTFDTSNFNDELDDNDIVNTKELDDSDVSNTNVFSTGNINMKKVKANLLGPRQQEKYGKLVNKWLFLWCNWYVR
ncbi:hypothetical protein BDF14DRAFT_75857 [Spinellus fusiger]|nr:hypothetical protein BDF14DRAFT_75857 [Spinellus fusiger]